jgi:hypothetical protein
MKENGEDRCTQTSRHPHFPHLSHISLVGSHPATPSHVTPSANHHLSPWPEAHYRMHSPRTSLCWLIMEALLL